MPPLISEAINWWQNGYTPLPVKPDGSKAPAVPTWTAYQKQRPSLPETLELFKTDSDGIGLICGAVSGGLEMMELEGRAVEEGYYRKLVQAFTDHDQDELWSRINNGYVEETPSGGMHWYYRTRLGRTKRNTKLARRPGDDGPEVLIETRGEGGFTVVAPSAGRTHGTGKRWLVLIGQGSDNIPVLSEDERDTIHAIASTLDQMPVVEPQPPRSSHLSIAGELRPGDDYNNKATWQQILEPHGWTIHKHYGGNLYGWRKPNKQHPGISATTGRNNADRLYVFSTSTLFEPERPYSKFGAFTLLEHGGDYSAAAKALRIAGYGATNNPKDVAAVVPLTNGQTPPDEPQLTEDGYTQTDDGNALRLINTHHILFRRIADMKRWYTWDGTRWAQDHEDRTIRETARQLARNLPETDKTTKTFKRNSMSSAGITGCIRVAETDPRISIRANQLDNHPELLNTPNGIINLRTGTLQPHNPDLMLSRITAHQVALNTPCPHWQKFLNETFNDVEMINYIQRMIGLALLGNVPEHVLPFLNGTGANGKGVLTLVTQGLLGEADTGGYSLSAPDGFLMSGRDGAHPTEIARLRGARLAVCSEQTSGKRFDEAKVKRITGGDILTGRFMRGDFFDFNPSHLTWILSNHLPEVKEGGPSFWRRVRRIPFLHVVPEAERVPDLHQQLLSEEGPAILGWAVQGAVDVLRGGLQDPEAVISATNEYQISEDSLASFLRDDCLLGPHFWCPVPNFRDRYEKHCAEAGIDALSSRALTMRLTSEYGVIRDRLSRPSRRIYRNVALATEDENDDR